MKKIEYKLSAFPQSISALHLATHSFDIYTLDDLGELTQNFAEFEYLPYDLDRIGLSLMFLQQAQQSPIKNAFSLLLN